MLLERLYLRSLRAARIELVSCAIASLDPLCLGLSRKAKPCRMTRRRRIIFSGNTSLFGCSIRPAGRRSGGLPCSLRRALIAINKFVVIRSPSLRIWSTVTVPGNQPPGMPHTVSHISMINLFRPSVGLITAIQYVLSAGKDLVERLGKNSKMFANLDTRYFASFGRFIR